MIMTARRLLASGSVARVERCRGCARTLMVHVGPVSLRFDAKALRSLHRTLGDALGALDAEREDGQLALATAWGRPQRGQG